jgi:hypothetical protein
MAVLRVNGGNFEYCTSKNVFSNSVQARQAKETTTTTTK